MFKGWANNFWVKKEVKSRKLWAIKNQKNVYKAIVAAKKKLVASINSFK